MRKLAFFVLAALFMTLITDEAEAQMNRRNIKKNNKRIASYRGKKSNFGKDKVYNAVGVSLNAFNYFGDLSPSPKRISTDIGFTRPAIGASFTHRFGPRYQLTGSFMYGGIRGADSESADPGDVENGAFRYVRNLSFRNRIKELSVVAQVDLFENMATYISRVQWTPYVYAGVAVFHHNPQAQVPATDLLGNPFSDAGQWVNLQPLKTEGKSYSLIQPAIPFGLGARFRLNEVMDIAAEFGFRYTFTDYLDDVSGYYVDLNTLSSEKAKALSYRSNEVQPVNARVQEILANTYNGYTGFTTVSGYGHINSTGERNLRGSAKKNDRDIYMVTSVRLTYILGKTFHKAKFR
ncbi:MAG: hypothetical protein KF845_02535 [Cyclobacteriaceae bacterium]|nr:hypothetical protein [Cyclobacteriaceae bacterium]